MVSATEYPVDSPARLMVQRSWLIVAVNQPALVENVRARAALVKQARTRAALAACGEAS